MRHSVRAVLEDRPLASHLLAFTSQGTLQSLSRTCRFWHRSAPSLAPGASRALASMAGGWPEESLADNPSLARHSAGGGGSVSGGGSATVGTSQCSGDSGTAQAGEVEGQMLERRARLLESLRMSCQDPRMLDRSSSNDPSVWDGDEVFVGGGACGSDDDGTSCGVADEGWIRHRAFRDRGLSNEDLLVALRRAAPGDLRRLFVCGSKLSDEGVASALAPHWSALQDLGLRSCDG
eukprot:CAMPEP_0203890048 /NCGR_PEP_ID=MMETSP0359-20131031/33528_1 /ASSEMBLY_ACC=CAM_ASM_000338 /TAXON_ID=268821 /ORGANISM="Scrippsiella Hangoei, Strain SHTV-5" /LENGTH=234 /DNA_ID=CAMNT_0050811591 /DNA_START=73 /DNA_END=774 /DNA_ORIENTATION=+